MPEGPEKAPIYLLHADRDIGHRLLQLAVKLGLVGVLECVLQVPLPLFRLLNHLPPRVAHPLLFHRRRVDKKEDSGEEGGAGATQGLRIKSLRIKNLRVVMMASVPILMDGRKIGAGRAHAVI